MSNVKPQRAFAEGTPLLPPSPNRHSLARRWSRRLVTITLYSGLWALLWALLPVLVPLGWVIDRVRGKPVLVRAFLEFAVYLGCEIAGVIVAFFLWFGSLVWLGGSRHRFLRWNFRLQSLWLRAIFGATSRIYRWRVVVTGDEAVQRGNMLFFIRHASTADTVLAGVFVSGRHGICLRYVLKDQLLWDPCLDIVGNRLPNGFVARGGGRTEQAVAEVARLTDNLGPFDGVLIYPEGTRFTPKKRAKILARLAEKNAAASAAGTEIDDAEISTENLHKARALNHVLPPRLAGPLALLERASDADVVFCAHTGLEPALSFREFMAGALNDVVLHIGFWRVPRAHIPDDRPGQIAWLYEQWQRVDRWVGERLPEAESANGPSPADSGEVSGSDS